MKLRGGLALLLVAAAACAPQDPAPVATDRRPAERPSILLVTLDTTRADVLAAESGRQVAPHLDALAARGLRFRQAYATAPQTLPAHASILSGEYPSVHGIHENGRYLGRTPPLLAERLREAGYSTAAFVSGFPLAAQFGLARGFELYDDDLGEAGIERPAGETAERAAAYLRQPASRPRFLWVHFYDPHEPYVPPEPFRSRFAGEPYLGEVAAMDAALGRLLTAFEESTAGGPVRIAVAADHGESLGEHGEALHGNLLYQAVMRVPLVLAGDGIAAAVREEPVSARRIFGTVLAWAGLESAPHLLQPSTEVVLGEAMKPFLQYGWQPQAMAVEGRIKAIRAGELEVYDVIADPAESRNLAGAAELSRELRNAVRDYPTPSPASAEATEHRLDQEDRERLASLGYAGGQGSAPLRPDAPAPRQMTHLFAALDRGSGHFVHRRYAEAIGVFREVHEQDPRNLMVNLRLAVAHSALGHDSEALELFERARRIAPASADVRHYLAMHFFERGSWDDAAALFESVLAQEPGRLPALERLARIRERQGRLDEAAELLQRAVAFEPEPVPNLLALGRLRMAQGRTAAAITAFERARDLQDEAFAHHLELGVLYLAARRLQDARGALERVGPEHPGHAMALFKRAQVSVLLGEPDRRERIRRAREQADPTTRELIEREPLFAAEGM